MLLLAGALSLVVFLTSVGGFVVVTWFNNSVSRVDLSLDPNRPAPPPEGSENWLLVGTDNGRADVPGTRSDTVILTHLDADGTTTNVSFPRDTLVTIPAYTDAEGTTHPAHKAKFNEAITDNGPQLLVETVQDLTHILIDHYVSVNLAGFKQISEALDGVQVCILPEPARFYEDNGALTNINDGYSGFHGRYGSQTVVGDQALAFVRQRHGLPDSDISRIQRQQQFLGSVFRQATKSNVLFNPLRIARLLAAIKGSLTLDKGTSLTDLEKLALRLRGVDPGKIRFETIPQRPLETSDTDLGEITESGNLLELTPTGQSENEGSVQILEQAPFNAMIGELQDDSPSADQGVQTTPTPRLQTISIPAAQVIVTVQDGTGSTGLASTVTTALAKDGFQTGAPGPAGSTTYSKSEVLYAPGDEAAAAAVAAAVPGSVRQQEPTATGGVVLILGANYSIVDPVSVDVTPTQAPTTSPTPMTSTSPAAAPVTATSNSCTY